MKQFIPGSREEQGREFMYIESPLGENLHQMTDSASSIGDSLTVPASGGVMEENFRIKLGDKISLMGISYRGDIEGWRKRFVEICEFTGRKYGIVKDGRLVMSNGASFSLEDLESCADTSPDAGDPG